MFTRTPQSQLHIISFVSTFITFIFMLGFIFFSYRLATDMLLYKVIDTAEYTMKVDKWNYYECQNPDAYIHTSLGLENLSKTFSDEVSIVDDTNTLLIENLITENNAFKVESCKNEILTRAGSLQKIDYKIQVVKDGLGALFFLILFLCFSYQNQKIYRLLDNKKS